MPIRPAIQTLIPDMQAWRHQLHRQPEIAFQEHNTSEFVARKLRGWDIETHTGIGRTGVVGIIHGSLGSGPSIALRADMDALPIAEAGETAHRSCLPGVFHGCGHDGHTAILLGTACLLAKERRFRGRIVLIFQPAEETLQGSQSMLKDGLLQRFPFDEIYVLHNHPPIPAGSIGVRTGAQLASVDFFSIHITGVGSHGGTPHLSIDPIVVGATLVSALQTIISRSVDPLESAAISICRFQAGATANVIPEHALLEGTLRTLSRPVQQQALQRMRQICDGVALTHRCQIELALSGSTPPVINDPELTRHVIAAAQTVVGAAHLLEDITPIMAGDDVAEFLQLRPGCHFLLGQGGHMCHHPQYDFNDDVAPIGVAMFDQIVQRRLGA